jgi:hypothetical protein
MNSSKKAIEYKTVKKIYKYLKHDVLLNRIFKRLDSYKNVLNELSYIDKLSVDSDEMVGGGSSIDKYMDEILSKKVVNELGILSTDTPPHISKNHNIKLRKRKIKKYKRLYSNMRSFYEYMKAQANYYYYLLMMMRRQNYNLMLKLNTLYGTVNEWSNKVKTDMNATNDKIGNVEMILETLNGILERPIDVDLKVLGEVDKKTLQISSYIINGKNINGVSRSMQVGGNYEQQYEEAERKIQQIINNNKFINERFDSLKLRMKTVIADNNNLFKVRARVEWIVNRLEECIKFKDDTGAVEGSKDLADLLALINSHSDDKYLQTLTDMEALVAYLESVLGKPGTMHDTIKSLGSDKLKKMTEAITKMAELQKIKEEEKKAQAQVGGTVDNIEDKYLKKYKDFFNKFKYTGFTDELKIDPDFIFSEDDVKIIAPKYSQNVKILISLQQIKIMLSKFKNVINKYKAGEVIIWKILWKTCFLHKNNTDFYDILLDKEIFHFNNAIGTTTKAENIIINNNLEYSINKSQLDDIKFNNTIRNTYAFIGCLYYLLVKYLLFREIFHGNASDNDNIYKILETMDKNLVKAIAYTFNNHEIYYNNKNDSIQPTSSIWLNEEEFKNIDTALTGISNVDLKFESDESKNDVFLFNTFVTSRNKILARDPEMEMKDQLNAIIGDVKKNFSSYVGDMKSLKNRIANMLGEVQPDEQVGEPIGVSVAEMKTYKDILKQITDLENVGIPHSFLGGYSNTYKNRSNYYNRLSTNIIKQRGGVNTESRIQGKLKTLGLLYNVKIKSIMEIFQTLQKKLSEKTLLVRDEIEPFFQIYAKIKNTIDAANNNFIKVLPMIFFTIEFPPSIYLNSTNQNDHYTISYKYPQIVFKETRTTISTPYSGYHQAFIDKNKNNTTKDLLYDRLIGLDTITKMAEVEDAPVNSVSNIMFAVGASGTGKTVRYFGLKGSIARAEDKEGIIEYIIKKNKGSTISMAYFVCYGRSEETIGCNINETVFFVTETTDGKYNFQGYTMIVEEPAIEPTTKYTDFYVKLMSRKLIAIPEEDLLKFTKGANLVPDTFPESSENFRQILENKTIENKIWSNIDVDKIENVFDKMMLQQKNIKTIMPTINNIESSRGHTCILLRFTKQDGSTSYFPLFDMAGLENVKIIKDFYSTAGDANSTKFKQILENISTESYDLADPTKIVKFQKDKIDITSLKKIENELKAKANSVGGNNDKDKYKEKNIANIINTTDYAQFPTTPLTNKIEYEGPYINHTISTLIFAILCLGETQRAEPINNVDQFDNILSAVQNKMDHNAFCSCSNSGVDCKVHYLYKEKITYDGILNSSCIWAQIIFGFLYWNKETTKSTEKYFMTKNIDPDKMYYMCGFNKDANINKNGKIEISINDLTAGIDFKTIEAQFEELKNTCDNIEVMRESDNNVLYIKLSSGKIYKIDTKLNDLLNDHSFDISTSTPRWKLFHNLRNTLNNIYSKLNSTPGNPVTIPVNYFEPTNDKIDGFIKLYVNIYFNYFIALMDYDQYNGLFKNNYDKNIYDTYHLEYKAEIIKNINDKKSSDEPNTYVQKQGVGKIVVPLVELGETFGQKSNREAKNKFRTEIVNFITAQTKIKTPNIFFELMRHIYSTEKFNETLLDKHNKEIVELIFKDRSPSFYKFFIRNYDKYDAKEMSKYPPITCNDSKKEEDEYRCQIERVKDQSREFYPPTTILMHCITGQGEKHEMVATTLQMCETLYKAVDISKPKI